MPQVRLALGAMHFGAAHKEGAVFPLNVDDDSTGLGSAASTGRLTVMAYPATTRTTFKSYDEDGKTTELASVRDDRGVTVEASRAPQGLVLRVFTPGGGVRSVGGFTARATRDAFDAAAEGWLVDGDFTWVRVAPRPGREGACRLAHDTA